MLALAGFAGANGGVVRLDGHVTAVGEGDVVSVSLGGRDGLLAGDEGTVARVESFPDGSRRRTNVARIRVTAVRADGADATVVQSVARVEVGQPVAFLYRGGTTRCVGALDLARVPAGTGVTVDGSTVRTRGPMVLHGVPCGERVVVLQPPDGEEVRQTVTVARGEAARVALAPGPPGPAPAPGEPPGPEAAPALAALLVSAWGYEGVGLLQGVLTLGLLASQYAVEVDDRLVLGWKMATDEATVRVPPGPHRLRVLVRSVLGRAPMPLHEAVIEVRPGVTNEARVNFLISAITVNGDRGAFNRLQNRP